MDTVLHAHVQANTAAVVPTLVVTVVQIAFLAVPFSNSSSSAWMNWVG